MKYLNTKHEQKSAVITVVLMASTMLLMLFFGMEYMDPPEEYGVAINFGTSDVGSGPPKVQETVKSAPVPTQAKQQVSTPQEAPVEEVEEEVVTQNTEDAPVIEKSEAVKEEVPIPVETPKEIVKPEPIVEEKPIPEEVPEEVSKPEPIVEDAPKPSEETKNALSNLFNGNPSDGESSSGEGDDKDAGLKGDISGDPNSKDYYANGGSGGDGNYNLSGRKAIGKPEIVSECNEGGTVVVDIQVDRSGNVIKADPGAKGTIASPCLQEAAKKAAMSTKWDASPNADPVQKGQIKFNFSISK